MTKPSGAPTGGRPVDARKREAIVAAGWELFLARGVSAVPMEAVATQSGVSKVTLYKHFPDKAALLEAGVLAEMDRIERAQRIHDVPVPVAVGPAFAAHPTVADGLRVFGRGIMHFLASPHAIAFYANLAGELARHHDLAQQFWLAGPGRTRANLTALIAAAAAAGEIETDDPDEAADHLFGLWQGFSNFQLSLGVADLGDPDDIDLRVDHGVDRFLRAYAPAPKPPAS